MRIKFDFSAPEGTHFGVVKTLEELLADIPAPVDYWHATADSVTNTDGRVSAWTGALGRQFIQATAARRPTYTGNGLRMFNAAGDAAEATMTLGGEQIGAAPSLTIACKIRMSAAAVAVDSQYIWVCPTPLHRLMYRYTAGNNYLRAQVLATSNNLDRDVPADVADIGAVYVASGSDYTLHVPGMAPVSYAGAEGANLPSLILGGISATSPSLRAWMQRVGVWRHVPTTDELDTLLKWVE
ncbi:hypothetical protein LOS78_01900 [Paracoccus sp. MA]|uniref:hypothetical protein n=1 Tax=Paracoccus sp. MA TaxID=2895796 RepID=UPI001E454236|nr:hypothetical protein [Paracoccus sp. MA]UFM64253.1 hypothetical protein LOS78_01900 [Paracoccus sp. MA]